MHDNRIIETKDRSRTKICKDTGEIGIAQALQVNSQTKCEQEEIPIVCMCQIASPPARKVQRCSKKA